MKTMSVLSYEMVEILRRMEIFVIVGGAVVLLCAGTVHAESFSGLDHVKYSGVMESEQQALTTIKEDADAIASRFVVKKSATEKNEQVVQRIAPRLDMLSKDIGNIIPPSSKINIELSPMPHMLSPETGMSESDHREKKE